METEITIPKVNWTSALAEAIKTAPHGATIRVHTDAMLELALRAAGRMGRADLVFIRES